MKTLTLTLLALVAPLSALAYGGSTSVGPAHPAASVCEQYQAQNISAEDGPGGAQSGYCRFADGSLVEHFSLWRGFSSSDAARAFMKSDFIANHRLAEAQGWTTENRVQKFCEYVGGKVANYNETIRKTSTFQMCEFADRSSVDSGSLYWGPSYAQTLVKSVGLGR